MKKLFILAAIAALAVACDTNTKPQPINGDANQISIRTLQNNGRYDTDANNILSFSLFGEWVANADGTGALMTADQFEFTYFNNIVRENAATTWKYAPKLYWPLDGGVNFYAYSPAGSVNTVNFAKTAATPKISYTAPDNKLTTTKHQEDLLVAAKKGQNKTAPGVAPVALMFFHALSQAKFVAVNSMEDLTFVVSDIQILNLKTTGDLDLSNVNPAAPATGNNPSYNDWAPLPAAWSNLTGKNAYYFLEDNANHTNYAYITPRAAADTLANGNMIYTKLGAPINMVPQTITCDTVAARAINYDAATKPVPADFTTEVFAAIRYKVVHSGDGKLFADWRWVFLPINLVGPQWNASLTPAVTTNTFVMGVSYTFVINFNDTLAQLIPITFTADVFGWVEPNQWIPIN